MEYSHESVVRYRLPEIPSSEDSTLVNVLGEYLPKTFEPDITIDPETAIIIHRGLLPYIQQNIEQITARTDKHADWVYKGHERFMRLCSGELPISIAIDEKLVIDESDGEELAFHESSIRKNTDRFLQSLISGEDKRLSSLVETCEHALNYEDTTDPEDMVDSMPIIEADTTQESPVQELGSIATRNRSVEMPVIKTDVPAIREEVAPQTITEIPDHTEIPEHVQRFRQQLKEGTLGRRKVNDVERSDTSEGMIKKRAMSFSTNAFGYEHTHNLTTEESIALAEKIEIFLNLPVVKAYLSDATTTSMPDLERKIALTTAYIHGNLAAHATSRQTRTHLNQIVNDFAKSLKGHFTLSEIMKLEPRIAIEISIETENEDNNEILPDNQDSDEVDILEIPDEPSDEQLLEIEEDEDDTFINSHTHRKTLRKSRNITLPQLPPTPINVPAEIKTLIEKKFGTEYTPKEVIVQSILSGEIFNKQVIATSKPMQRLVFRLFQFTQDNGNSLNPQIVLSDNERDAFMDIVYHQHPAKSTQDITDASQALKKLYSKLGRWGYPSAIPDSLKEIFEAKTL